MLNSEAWVNLSDKDIRALEQTDEILLSKILGCDANTSNVFKYLELGVQPVRYEIMKRNILFLHYLLQQDKNSMIFKVLQATRENPVHSDFVLTCEKYLKQLNINITFEQLGVMSTWSVKKLVKEKTSTAAFKYLLEIKNKQTKISHIQYDDLEIQSYLLDGNRNIEESRVIYKARSLTLNIKTQKSWKYKDDLCVGCGVKSETVEEFLSCMGYSEQDTLSQPNPVDYNLVFDGELRDRTIVAKELIRRLKLRDKILDEETP